MGRGYEEAKPRATVERLNRARNERARLVLRPRLAGTDGAIAAVTVSRSSRREAKCRAALCDAIGRVAPLVDHLVEVEVQRAEVRARDVPVRLLALQREVGHDDEDVLELLMDQLSLRGAQRRTVIGTEIVDGHEPGPSGPMLHGGTGFAIG